MVRSVPRDLGLPGTLWTPEALGAYLERLIGRKLSSRTVDRYLERWGWSLPSLTTTPPSRSGRAVSEEVVTQLAAQAKAHGGQLVWATLHSVAGAFFIVARRRRGSPFWMGFAHSPDAAAWTTFSDRLVHSLGQKLWIIMPENVDIKQLQSNHRVEWVSGNASGESRANSIPERAEARVLLPGKNQPLSNLDRLEAESIHIMREVVAEADNPVMLYSIGKDSSVMLHLAMKAFHPGRLPFPLLHVDTTWKFRDMYRFRDQRAKDIGARLIVHTNQEGLAQGINPFDHGSAVHTDVMKTQALKQALDSYGFDVAFGGARRDEEKSRAKERIFSFRSEGHRWDPKNQRPELWRLYNTRKRKGESLRVFPLSNWTELDIWLYIHRENIPIVPLYFAAPRPVVERDGLLFMVDDERMRLRPGETPQVKRVRFRTLGCYPLTAAIESNAVTLPEIIHEMLATTTSERQGRVIDFDGAGSMEKKKQEGYF